MATMWGAIAVLALVGRDPRRFASGIAERKGFEVAQFAA